MENDSYDEENNDTYDDENTDTYDDEEKKKKKKKKRILFSENIKEYRQVAYMYSEELCQICSNLPVIANLHHKIWELNQACQLMDYIKVVHPPKATKKELLAFHSPSYIKILEQFHSSSLTKMLEEEEFHSQDLLQDQLEKFSLVDDCFPFQNIWNYCLMLGGASLAAAQELIDGNTDIAINWFGGRHHAKKANASGFCFVNDAVLSILHLQKQKFPKVLCIDIDVHHGDGIEEAFYCSSSVFNVSFHKYDRGYFPGTGAMESTGIGRGKFYNLNVPLGDGTTDETFLSLLQQVVQRIIGVFAPSVIVMVCGVDTLASDPLGTFNLTSQGLSTCIDMIATYAIPLLLLGGGGYSKNDSPRAYCTMTAAALGNSVYNSLPQYIPYHEYFPIYGPDFLLHTKKVIHREEKNSQKDMQVLHSHILETLEQLLLKRNDSGF